MSLRIIRPGLLTTVQDLGRLGYQQNGIIVSGAMDVPALRVANLLVGNANNAAGLEITLRGPKIHFTADHLIALTGAHLSPTLNGEPLGLHRPVWVAAGTELAFGAPSFEVGSEDGATGLIHPHLIPSLEVGGRAGIQNGDEVGPGGVAMSVFSQIFLQALLKSFGAHQALQLAHHDGRFMVDNIAVERA